MLLLSNISFASLLTHPMLLPRRPSPLLPVVREQGSDHMMVRAASCGGETGSGDVAALDRPEWGNNDQLTVHTKAVWWGVGWRVGGTGCRPVWLHPDEASPRRCRAVPAQFDCLSVRPRFRGAAEWCQTVNAQSALIKNRFSRPSSTHSRRRTQLILYETLRNPKAKAGIPSSMSCDPCSFSFVLSKLFFRLFDLYWGDPCY